MRYFEILFEYKTRPLYRKGRLRTESHVFAADDALDALRMAKEYGATRFHRQKHQAIDCRELTVPDVPNS